MRFGGLTAATTTAYLMEGNVFIAYIEHALVPSLRPGDVAVHDNVAYRA